MNTVTVDWGGLLNGAEGIGKYIIGAVGGSALTFLGQRWKEGRTEKGIRIAVIALIAKVFGRLNGATRDTSNPKFTIEFAEKGLSELVARIRTENIASAFTPDEQQLLHAVGEVSDIVTSGIEAHRQLARSAGLDADSIFENPGVVEGIRDQYGELAIALAGNLAALGDAETPRQAAKRMFDEFQGAVDRASALAQENIAARERLDDSMRRIRDHAVMGENREADDSREPPKPA